jgi:hypothetical protein
MSFDFGAVAAAIATRFSAAEVTPPAGYGEVRVSTHLIPNALTSFPTVVVFPPEVTFSYTPSSRQAPTTDFVVRLYLDKPMDYGRATTKVYAWMTALYGQLDGQFQLGLGYVAWAQVVSMGAGELRFGDAGVNGAPGYPGIEFTVRVHLVEGVAFTA